MSEFPDATRACARPGLAGEIQHPLVTIATELRNLRVVLERIERRMMTPAERAEADRKCAGSVAGNGTETPRTAPAVFTVATLAERWQCSSTLIYGLLKSGKLRGWRFGGKDWRISPDAVGEFEAVKPEVGCASVSPRSAEDQQRKDRRLSRMIRNGL